VCVRVRVRVRVCVCVLSANADWLAPVAADRFKATCRYCSCILRAHYSDLQLHSRTVKHQRNAKSATVGGRQPTLSSSGGKSV